MVSALMPAAQAFEHKGGGREATIYFLESESVIQFVSQCACACMCACMCSYFK